MKLRFQFLLCTLLIVVAVWAVVLVISSSLTRVPTPVPTPVHFVLPSGFNGPFVVAVLSQQPPASSDQNSCREFRIPSNGVLIVEDDSVFYSRHVSTVSTLDGTISRAVPEVITGRIKGPNAIFLEQGSGQGRKWRENYFYFGSPDGQHDIKKLDAIDAILSER